MKRGIALLIMGVVLFGKMSAEAGYFGTSNTAEFVREDNTDVRRPPIFKVINRGYCVKGYL